MAHGGGIGLTIEIEGNEKKKFIPAALNPYLDSFLKGKTYREACYECLYATKERIADITLGDYWGIESKHPDFPYSDGVSAILVNSPKGKELFKLIEHKIEYIESSFDKVKEKNLNLVQPTKRPEYRNEIYKELDEKQFKKYAKENLKYKKKLKNIVKNIIPKKMKKKIKQFIK